MATRREEFRRHNWNELKKEFWGREAVEDKSEFVKMTGAKTIKEFRHVIHSDGQHTQHAA